MDKYTIDLDKLLNDFEYSEFTEQQNNILSSNCQNSQPNYPSSSFSNNDNLHEADIQYTKTSVSSQKHSINNVFHSLNEYLNSDIKTDLNTASTSSVSVNEIHDEIPELIKISSKEKIDIPSIEEIFKNISKDDNVETTNNLIQNIESNSESADIKTINNNIHLKSNLNSMSDYLSTNSAEEIIDSNRQLEDNDTILVKDKNNIEKEITENEESNVEIPEEKNLISNIKNNDQCVVSTRENTSKILNINDDSIEVMILEQPAVQPIKFENSIDLSDTEIENELEELEKQYEDKLKVNNNYETTEEKVLDEDFTSAKSFDDYENNEIISVIQSETVETETNCVNIVTNSDVEINDENIIDESNKNAIEISNSTESSKNPIGNIEENNLQKETETFINKEIDATIQEYNNKIERKNSLLRPNSLELNSESTNDSLTINLIGEPGSTPYNNVYVSLPENSDISKNSIITEECSTIGTTSTSCLVKESAQVETEISNNSLSPTLSETSSTYDNSNTDSPNTSDSCNDTSLDETTINENTPKNTSCIKRNENNQEELDGDNSNNSNENFPSAEQQNASVADTENNHSSTEASWLGKSAPFWTPDSDALCCLHCNLKFTVIKRRHHCRACGLVLCSKCCNMKCKLEYMDNQEARVCTKCYEVLTKETVVNSSSGSETSPENHGGNNTQNRRLNPNNPMDYCSTVPPLQQVSGAPSQPPTVMVPVGVLKRKGSGKNRTNKSVMFMDGIRPGCDLTELDTDFNYKQNSNKSQNLNNQNDASHSNSFNRKSHNQHLRQNNRNLPKIDPQTSSYIPAENDGLPPIVNIMKSDIFYADCLNNNSVVEMLKNEMVTFAVQRNFHVQVRIINMECCINKQAWCFTTDGMISVGQDEIIILLEFIDNERIVPKDIFLHLNNIYSDAVKGTSITELGLSIHPTSNFLESKNHAGFLYIKPTFQCIQNVIIPKEPYLIGILIHRWETPWAKIFPLRLLLRLGAEYRYYPSPIISSRHRESVYVEIGHTIINLLADFRNFSYTIPSVRGLTIHMEDKNTTVSIPMNRYDQVMKALNNSSDHILAFAANFSPKADAHLVCIQDTHGNNENAYTTHAINIHNKPRKITGASFIVLNGALKSSSGLTAKSSIIEDGLMIQILPEQMLKLRNSLKNMKNFKINCGCVNAQSDESVSILWTENDVNFNIGVISSIDNMALSGIPSIRVHNGRDFICNSGNKMIRWTEVFIIQSGEEIMRTQDPIDISKISESISKATSQALVKYLDLLATNSCTKIGIRTTLHVENVSYLAGSNGTKLPPIYMKSLDNELIPVLHKITSNFSDQASVVLELKFHILNV